MNYHQFNTPKYLFMADENNHDQTRVTELEQQLADCRISESEWKDRYMLLSADFANYKRRISKEQASWTADAQGALLGELLAIVDNIDRALEHKVQAPSDDVKTWLEGFGMIQKSLHAFLRKNGVEEVSYETFDPHFHEALMEVESPDHASGAIVTVLQKGYRMGDKVIRAARVSVAK